MSIRGAIFFLCLAIVTGQSAFAQTNEPDTLRKEKKWKKSSFIPIPIVYYTPETRWAGGVAALYTFRLSGQSDEARPSQIQLGLAYTQEKQILIYLPFQFFSRDENWQTYGELGYYRYVYQFFGIGNNTRTEDEESYDVTYPRVRLNLLRQVAPHHFLGIRYWWDNYRITHTAEGGLLDQQAIAGNRGSVVSGTGLVWNYDSRDQLFYPTKGFWTEAEIFSNSKSLGSDFNFSRFSLDASAYFSKNPKQVLALNAFLVFTQGNPPFQQLAFIGGPKKMRGHFEGRYRDKNLWMFQAEYRLALAGRFGATVFGGVGAVAPDMAHYFAQPVHFSIGAGLRFLLGKKDYINLRLDVGANENGEIFPYLTVREAF